MASAHEAADAWSVERASQGGGGISAFLVRTRTGDGLMVKVARAEAGRASLERAAAAQRAVHAIGELGAWRSRLPSVVSEGDAGEWRFVVETALSGRSLDLPGPDDPGWSAALDAVLDAIDGLHQTTATTGSGSDRRARWVDGRAATVASLEATIARTDPAAGRSMGDVIARLTGELGDAVLTGDLAAGWVHGDYWSANVLVDDSGAVSGIVDWDSAEPDELAAQDAFHLVLYARKLRRRVGLGAVVAEVLGAGTLDAHELAVLERTSPPGLGVRSTALLYWLRFVDSNLRRQPALATSERWLASNVAVVMPWV
jgi:aminoglycoside phosphotransferase (APT) family kinase protein